MFIKYNPKNPHVKTIPIVMKSSDSEVFPLANDSVILRPGTNELTESEWEAIQPHVMDEIKHKIIVPFTVEVKKAGGVTKARTLKDVPVSVARKIIASCQNVADLKKWVRQELSDEIMLLVLKRLRGLKIDPDELTDDMSGEEDTLDDDITSEADTGDGDITRNDNDGDDPPKESGGAKAGRKRRKKRTQDGEGNDDPLEDDDDDPPKESGGAKAGRKRRKKRTQDGEGNDDPLEDDDDEIPDFDGNGNGGGND